MKRKQFFTYITSVFLTLTGFTATESSEGANPAWFVAYDVGSTTTRIEIAEKTADEDWVLRWSLNNRISTLRLDEEGLQSAFMQFQNFRKEALGKLPKNATITERGVATAGLRGSGDFGVFFEKWAQGLGIDFHMISQDVESLLALSAVQLRLPKNPTMGSLCIWDIGGGSAQLLCQVNGEIITSGSEISARNASLFWEKSHCMSNEEISDELSCRLENLMSLIYNEEVFTTEGYQLSLFPLQSLEQIKRIVNEKNLIIGAGSVHQYLALEALKNHNILHDGNEYNERDLLALLALKFTREDFMQDGIGLLSIYITLNLLNQPKVQVVSGVNNAVGLIASH